MILEVKVVQLERTSPRAAKTKRVVVYRCDQCLCVYEGKYQERYLSNRRYHLCSRKCMAVSRSHGGVAVEYQLSRRDVGSWHASLLATFQDRYGVDNPGSLEWVKQKKLATFRARYGVDNPLQIPSVKRRALETWAAHSSHTWMSGPEKRLRVLLDDVYGRADVKVQQLIEHKWSVDFYVKSIDTYVQFDGVYWHGLDRPLDVIKASKSKRDQAIYDKWLKDRELDKYVQEHGMRLVRITDQEFKADPEACLLKIAGTDVSPLPHPPRAELHL